MVARGETFYKLDNGRKILKYASSKITGNDRDREIQPGGVG